MLEGVEIAELETAMTVTHRTGVLRLAGVELELGLQIVKLGVQRQLTVVVINFPAAKEEMLDRQIENVQRLVLFLRHLRLGNIGAPRFVDEEVNDRVIDDDLVQIHLAPQRGNDLQAHTKVIRSKERFSGISLSAVNHQTINVGPKTEPAERIIADFDSPPRGFLGFLNNLG